METIEQKILKALENCDFYNLSEDTCYEKICEPLFDALDYKEFEYGATKAVIILNNADFVIKIPLEGSFLEDEEYDEEDDMWYGTGEYNFNSFSGAEDGKSGSDYCMVEVLKFKAAKEWGLDFLFAETKKIGEVFGYPIYSQPICKPFCNIPEKSEALHKQRFSSKPTLAKEYCNYTNHHYCFNEIWLTDVIEYYGKDVFKQLMEFIYEENISDLHDGNLGYIENRPVIFDYSSFHD